MDQILLLLQHQQLFDFSFQLILFRIVSQARDNFLVILFYIRVNNY